MWYTAAMKHRNPVRRVAVALDLECTPCRDILISISDYIHQHHRLWMIRIFPNTKSITEQDLSGDFDGFILDDVAINRCLSYLCAVNKPIVVAGTPKDFPALRRTRVAFVHNDNPLLGRFGAQHLAGLGQFRSFGFVQEPGKPSWSQQRLEGYSTALTEKGFPVTLQGDTPLADYLRNLPKPAAIMCTSDRVGAEAIATCTIEGIKVPKDMAVLSVDNDCVLCDIFRPSLSSIQPDYRKYGILVATALDRLFRTTGTARPMELVNSGFKLISRKSTMPIATSIHLVDKALAYIRANATRNISVDDVVTHLGVSRQLVYLRFSETSEGTLAKVILRTRLAEVARRLRNTRQPIVQIAKTCSFGSLQYLANAFKRRYGVSMTAYRARNSR